MVYIFNPSNWEAERGDLLSSRPARPTQLALVSCLQTKKLIKESILRLTIILGSYNSLKAINVL